ncbi:VanZ family protein [Oceanobacillus senegalensis]|uniref:VanZ family protein n=1 Tax=Oceanobacillus senegalensis TaxID=1936063 RepID=UPI002481A89C|nr:VanZ family protein [Oceanobacillus senegalensis]
MLSNNGRKKSYYTYSLWAAVVLWMAVIFTFSHESGTASSERSTGVTVLIETAINTVIPADAGMDRENFQYFIRKTAHFSVYFVLSILVVNALRASNVVRSRAWWLTLLISILYAASDEFHQLFIPGRSGQVTDVLIDTVGASVGLGVYWLSSWIWRKERRKTVRSKEVVRDD